tara:strand:+ start:267 stop:686 length:420 start_codon:yes stop_codon:yes gene_type:complete
MNVVSKSATQANRTGTRVQSFVFMVSFLIAMSIGSGTAESGDSQILLNTPGPELKTFRVAKSADVRLSNDSQMTLLNFTVIQVASGKRMLSIKELEPHASLNLAFDRAGTYIACYRGEIKKNLSKSTCLQIDVVGLRSI